MKKLTTSILLGSLCIFALLSSCKKDDTSSSSNNNNTNNPGTNTTLTGKWGHVWNSDTLNLLLTNGMYVFYYGIDTASSLERGTYTSSGSNFTINASAGSGCENMPGQYTEVISGQNMTLTLISDACSSGARANAIKGSWFKK